MKVNHVLLLEKDTSHIASRLVSFLKDPKTVSEPQDTLSIRTIQCRI